MGVTSTETESDQNVASGASPANALNFDLIKARAAANLNIPVTEVTDQLVADLVGLARESVTRLRNGSKPSTDTLVAFADALGTTIDALLTRTGATR